jgi:hypothetical protein
LPPYNRLAWLAEHDLVHAWRAVIRAGHIRRATNYLLSAKGARALADWRDQDRRTYVERADHVARRRHHIVHVWGFKTPIVFEEAAGNEGRVNLKLWCSQLASGGGEGSAAGPAR